MTGETVTILLFCLALLICIFTKTSLIFALLAGLVLFTVYALRHGFRGRDLPKLYSSGIRTVGKVVVTMLIIGVLVAFWRAAGTIPCIVVYSVSFVRPSLFLAAVYLLNGLVSVLTGTSFGTAATMGVITATIGGQMGISPALTGGAVLSGIYIGDRCSPVSTSALLVAQVTKTDIYTNIRGMIRTSVVPVVLTTAVYLLIGILTPHRAASVDPGALFSREFTLEWTTLIPALVILVLSLFRVDVILSMLASIVSAIPLCILVQGLQADQLLTIAAFGYTAKDPSVGRLIDGGGVQSMLGVITVLLLTSAYAGIFEQTPLLDGIHGALTRLSRKTTPFITTMVTASATAVITCNQTLGIMLTNQLCGELYETPEKAALAIEDTIVVMCGLVPWCIACAVPLAAIGAPTSSALFAFYLMLLPLCGAAASIFRAKRTNKKAA